MPNFRVSGSTGPAPTTIWFGKVPDSLNMLRGYHPDAALAQGVYDSFDAVNYLNQWTLWNESYAGGSNVPVVSLGAFTTAPDGTNTGQKLVEAATNSVHFASAGLFMGANTSSGEYGKLRLAGFFKDGGRRLILSIETPPGTTSAGFPGSRGGCKAIFDLAGGRIGVDNTLFGPAIGRWTVYPAQIKSFGNGWYLCSVEAFVQNQLPTFVPGQNNLYCFAMLDNGTGTAAESSTYSGDGVSGVYGWRTNLMPSRSYDLNTVTFFEDFNDLSSIDVNNTQADGYKFYMGCPTSLLPGLRAAAGDSMSVSDSVLITQPTPGTFSTLTTAYIKGNFWSDPGPPNHFPHVVAPQDPSGALVKLPLLYESRACWNYNDDTSLVFDSVASWSWCFEFICKQPLFGDPNSGTGPDDLSIGGREVDFFESFKGGGGLHGVTPGTSVLFYDLQGRTTPATTPLAYISPEVGSATSSVGMTHWNSNKLYAVGWTVKYDVDGNFYTCTNAPPSFQPPTDTSFWTPYVGHTPPKVVELHNVMHVYSTLMLPATDDDFGMVIQFFDGIFAAIVATYGPTHSQERRLQNSDNRGFSFMNGGATPVSEGGDGLVHQIDWIKITQ